MGQKSKQARRAAQQSKTAQAAVRAGAKFGQQKKAEDDAPKIVMSFAGHLISHIVTGRTDCGIVPGGWAYVAPEKITCGTCLNGKKENE